MAAIADQMFRYAHVSTIWTCRCVYICGHPHMCMYMSTPAGRFERCMNWTGSDTGPDITEDLPGATALEVVSLLPDLRKPRVHF